MSCIPLHATRTPLPSTPLFAYICKSTLFAYTSTSPLHSTDCTSKYIPNCRIHPPPNTCHLTRSPTFRRQTALLCVGTEPTTRHELPTNCIMSLLATCSSRYYQLILPTRLHATHSPTFQRQSWTTPLCVRKEERRKRKEEAGLLHATKTNISTLPTCSSKYQQMCCRQPIRRLSDDGPRRPRANGCEQF